MQIVLCAILSVAGSDADIQERK